MFETCSRVLFIWRRSAGPESAPFVMEGRDRASGTGRGNAVGETGTQSLWFAKGRGAGILVCPSKPYRASEGGGAGVLARADGVAGLGCGEDTFFMSHYWFVGRGPYRRREPVLQGRPTQLVMGVNCQSKQVACGLPALTRGQNLPSWWEYHDQAWMVVVQSTLDSLQVTNELNEGRPASSRPGRRARIIRGGGKPGLFC